MAEIDEYLAGLDSENAKIIGDAYATARTLVPEAEQGISYGMPALIFHSRPLLSLMRAKGTVRLPLGAEIPEIVIRQLVLARSDEILAALAKKPTARPRVVKHAE